MSVCAVRLVGKIATAPPERRQAAAATALARVLAAALGNVKPRFGICEAIFVEHSFSDFGDADVLLLLRKDDEQQAVFSSRREMTLAQTSSMLVVACTPPLVHFWRDYSGSG